MHPDVLIWIIGFSTVDFSKEIPIGNVRYVPVHKCAEKDWKKFPPPSKTDKLMIEQYRRGNMMSCLSELDDHGEPYRHNRFYGTLDTVYFNFAIAGMFCHPKGIPNIHPL